MNERAISGEPFLAYFIEKKKRIKESPGAEGVEKKQMNREAQSMAESRR